MHAFLLKGSEACMLACLLFVQQRKAMAEAYPQCLWEFFIVIPFLRVPSHHRTLCALQAVQ